MASAKAEKRPIRRLTREIKAMIVTELACFSGPAEIRDLVEKEFGYRITHLSQIIYYDPTSAHTDLSDGWRKLFEVTREKYLKDVGRVPIMHKAYRARQLQKILDIESERKNTVGARDTLKQAAEEEGGVFTNRRELTGAGGKDLPVAALTVEFVQAPGKANADG